MSKNPSEIVVGANGSIYGAPVGSTVPASIAVPLGASFFELGYATENGVKFTDGKTVQPVRAWQSLYDLRQIIASKDTTAVFELMQWNDRNFPFAFGGGEVTAVDAGHFRYTPPAPEELGESMLAVEWEDSGHNYRLIVPRGMPTANVETDLVRTAAALLPVTFSVLGTDGVAPWIFDTDDPAFDPASGS